MRACRKCNGEYSDRFFQAHKNLQRAAASYKDLICIGCQQSDRDTKKRASRPREKARRTIRTHAEKYVRLGIAKTTEEFIDRFGWDIDLIAHQIDHAYQNGCAYCHEMFSEMGNGLADVTLDIINPEALPFYNTNTKWVCGTCNRAKKRKSPNEWEERIYDMKLWEKQQKKLNLNPYAGLPIFEDLEKQ